MRAASPLPVTVKHRIGIGRDERYGLVRDFVGTVAERGGAEVFVVHARNAWLEGLSPKQNREVPPLRHDVVHRLKSEFPRLTIVVNGGIATHEQIAAQLRRVDGVMVGRAAYQQPWSMAEWDRHLHGDETAPVRTRFAVEDAMVAYMERLAARGKPWQHAARHMVGLMHGVPGARRWRQLWSDAARSGETPRALQRRARAALAMASADAEAAA
jgi:tRNA-dihydrouridine synthase A